jgi:hypothetical protein
MSTFVYLEEITNIDKESRWIGWHLNPRPLAIAVRRQKHLQAIDVVCSEQAKDLRVRVLTEPDPCTSCCWACAAIGTLTSANNAFRHALVVMVELVAGVC